MDFTNTISVIAGGLLTISFIVLLHEFGHYIAGRLCGVTVEVFSIGMGKALLSKKIGDTEFRLSMIPFGGYCRYKGGEDLQKAIEEGKEELDEPSPGSLFSVSPLKRIFIAAAGPLMNLATAIILFTLVFTIGYSYQSNDPQIVVSESKYKTPAKIAGLQTGDIITRIGDTEIVSYNDIREIAMMNADVRLPLSYIRNGQEYTTYITPAFDQASGYGKIGIEAYGPVQAMSVLKDSTAEKLGLQANDIIREINGTPIEHVGDLSPAIAALENSIVIKIDRQGETMALSYVSNQKLPDKLGIHRLPTSKTFHTPEMNVFQAFGYSFIETGKSIHRILSSIKYLFKNGGDGIQGGIGMIGTAGAITTTIVQQDFGKAVIDLSSFIAMLSIALGFMNLLPIPGLDGGSILLYLIVGIRGKMPKVKTVYRYQVIGFTILLLLFLFATFKDITSIF